MVMKKRRQAILERGRRNLRLPGACARCWLAGAILAAGVGVSGIARAAQTCASSASAIQSALTVGVNNGQDDTIRVVAGTYTLSAGLTFNSTEMHSLTISGGWNVGCTEQSFADTIIDGNDTVGPLDVYNANGSILVERLTFESGKATGFGESPVSLSSNNQSVEVDLNRFFANHSAAGTGGLSAYAGTGGLYVRNNLFVGNHGGVIGGAAPVVGTGNGYVVGNTFVANITDSVETAGGLDLAGNGHYWISNNIVWNNTATANTYDFRALAAHTRIGNDIGVVGSGTAADLVLNELYVDPQFAPCGGFICLDFHLAYGSPLINAGNDSPAGFATDTDLDGNPRLTGAHMDIGAYESDVLFANGFQ